jgi:tetratricopeptide (TPR) repeat protein
MKLNLNIPLPLEAQYLYRRGLEMLDQQKIDAAVTYFRRAVFIAPGFSKAYREMGNCLTLLGHPVEAAASYAKAARIEPPCYVAVTATVN